MTPERLLEIGTTLGNAIGEERPVTITYVSACGDRTTRTVEPYEVAATQRGDFICRAMDRRSGERRSFRLDRIELITVREGGFEIERRGEVVAHVGAAGEDLMPEILVRYHGSRGRHHGVMRLLGICGCVRCASDGVRYRLAEVGSHWAAVWCVRSTSFTPLEAEEAEEATREAAEDAALARIRAEIDLVPVYDHRGDAARWSPQM